MKLKIAVVGRGTAGSLAAACITKIARAGNDIELHHIYDSRIPVIGVGEGGWPSLVIQLHEITGIPHEQIQQRLNATRKYGVSFEGWGQNNKDFTHYFIPQQVSYSYHLSADLITKILEEATVAQHIDTKVRSITKAGQSAIVDFDNKPPESYDLVFDARGFPKEISPEQHMGISFIPTNTAIIRRCPPIFGQLGKGPCISPTYTRSVARPHGWVFIIPLTTHTSYGYIFNSNCSDIEDVNSDFDDLMEIEGIREFEKRAVIQFPNFVHKKMYEGPIARIGNAGAFMEPLQATAIVSAQIQIGMILKMRENRPVEYWDNDVKAINNFLINRMLGFGLFVGWHYSCGSKYDTEFWRYAKQRTWPKHRINPDPENKEINALSKFNAMLDLLKLPVIDEKELNRHRTISISSYAQMSHGLGYDLFC